MSCLYRFLWYFATIPIIYLLPNNCPHFAQWRHNVTAPTCAILFKHINCTGEPLPLGIHTAVLGEDSTILRNENFTLYEDSQAKEFSTSRSASVRPGCYIRYEVEYTSSFDSRKSQYDSIKHTYYWEHESKLETLRGFACDCYSADPAVLTCEPTEEWLLLREFDNRRSMFARIFDFNGIEEAVVSPSVAIPRTTLGLDGIPIPEYNPSWNVDESARGTKAAFHAIVHHYSLPWPGSRYAKWSETAKHCQKWRLCEVLVEPGHCSFVLQHAYKCGSYRLTTTKTHVRAYKPSVQNEACSVDYASVVE